MNTKTLKQNKIDREELQEIALLIQSGASERSIADLFDLDINTVKIFKGSEQL